MLEKVVDFGIIVFMINIEEFWEDAKNDLSISIQAISFEVWIDKLEPVCFVDNAIVLATISANISSVSAIGTKDKEVSLWNNSFKNIRIINFLKTMPTRIFI